MGFTLCSFISRHAFVSHRPRLSAFNTELAVVAGAPGTTTNFEPVLNIPAFCAFAIIAAVFGLLQYRVSQIEQAVVERQEKLQELRQAKAAQLVDDSNFALAQKATESYTEAYWRVERLRTIAPGIRIRAPVENELNARGAQQFLGISPPPKPEEAPSPSGTLGPTVSAVVLGVIALSQIGLLLLLSSDPLVGAVGTLEGSF